MSDSAILRPLQLSLRHSEQFVVRPMHTAPEIDATWPGFRDMPPVLAELVAIDGKSLRFRVRCSDEAGLIGEGTHERAIVDFEKFSKRVAQKGDRFHV